MPLLSFFPTHTPPPPLPTTWTNRDPYIIHLNIATCEWWLSILYFGVEKPAMFQLVAKSMSSHVSNGCKINFQPCFKWLQNPFPAMFQMVAKSISSHVSNGCKINFQPCFKWLQNQFPASNGCKMNFQPCFKWLQNQFPAMFQMVAKWRFLLRSPAYDIIKSPVCVVPMCTPRSFFSKTDRHFPRFLVVF